MKEFWNERFGQEEFAYGEQPNEFYKQQIDKLIPGKILFPAEGEGRNSVYAAGSGWQVSAFDYSDEGKKKADKLAKKNQVIIEYRVGDIAEIQYPDENFDVIVLIFAHFPPDLRTMYHRKITKFLKKNGMVIMEAFSKKHFEYQLKNEKAGGPKSMDMLYSKEDIIADFSDFEIIELTVKEVELNEGLYHSGRASVIRFVGQKK